MEKIKLGTLLINNKAVDSSYPISYDSKFIIGLDDTQDGKEIRWIPFNGILIADRCLLNGIAFTTIDFFKRNIIIDGRAYLLRTPTKEEIEKAFEVIGDTEDIWHCNLLCSWTKSNYSNYDNWIFGCVKPRYWTSALIHCDFNNIGWRPVLELLKNKKE